MYESERAAQFRWPWARHRLVLVAHFTTSYSIWQASHSNWRASQRKWRASHRNSRASHRNWQPSHCNWWASLRNWWASLVFNLLLQFPFRARQEHMYFCRLTEETQLLDYTRSRSHLNSNWEQATFKEMLRWRHLNISRMLDKKRVSLILATR